MYSMKEQELGIRMAIASAGFLDAPPISAADKRSTSAMDPLATRDCLLPFFLYPMTPPAALRIRTYHIILDNMHTWHMHIEMI